jgi:hypothetical protein
MEVLHACVELVLAGEDPEHGLPGVMPHLEACGRATRTLKDSGRRFAPPHV